LAERRKATVRQAPDEVLDHRAQATRNLEVFRAVQTYFAKGEIHEILPVWRLKDDP